jgi:tetratricopeptide (TPR) repeat protein
MSPGYVKALADYEKAMAAFHRRDLERAETLFQKVLDLHAAEAGDLADRSRVYLAACRKQTEQAERPRGFDDHYNQGIYHANRGEYREAAAMFEKALGLEPRSGKAHYALAAALAQLGEPARALDHLRRAVAADGANRRLARHDPDFGPLQDSPEFEEAITRTGPGG